MYSFNGTPLENPALGWKLIVGTSFFTPFSWSNDGISVPGRDGVIPVPSTLAVPTFPVVIYTKKPGLEALLAMWQVGAGTLLDDDTGRSIDLNVVTATPDGGGPKDKHVKVTAIVRAPDVFWRDSTETLSPAVALTSGSVFVPVLAGLSAPVRDAMIRVKGQAVGINVADSGGSFFRYTVELPAGRYLRFESATGQAFVTTTDTWVGGVEVTGSIVNGPGPYPLQLTPKFTDPANRGVELIVTTSSRTGAGVQVRGRRAYVV